MSTTVIRLARAVLAAIAVLAAGASMRPPAAGAAAAVAAAERPRVIVSTDIGGTDPDDFQSLVHLLLYADVLDLEGLVSSPYGPGRREHILEVIDHYEADYPALRTYSDRYPAPASLRAMTTQGAIASPSASGVGAPTDGSRWIVARARHPDPRPLWILVWGGLEDLAQALHDAPDIAPKLRVYFIGGPNKMWSVDAYDYIETQHPALWMIEANATYRGWFVGGEQAGPWGNQAFVAAHVAGRGALGRFFAPLLDGTMKMGDSPSVTYLLRPSRDHPDTPGWGGQFVRVWAARKTIFEGLTTDADVADAFGVVEFVLPVPAGMTGQDSAEMVVDGRIPVVGRNDGRSLRFRFSPRDAKVWPYAIRSSVPALDGRTGRFRAVSPTERTRHPSLRHPSWWIDDPDPVAAEGVHTGARTVSRWRRQFLGDFAERLRRLPLAAEVGPWPSPPWGPDLLQRRSAWYRSAEARAVADNVLRHQRATGGWPKNTNLSVPPATAASAVELDATIDNGATTTEVQFLARLAHATGIARYRQAVERGVDYLLAAQYPNGGWPQYYPLRDGYYTRITFNDGAMANVLTLLSDVAAGTAPYHFVDSGRRAKAAAAVERGIDVVLRTQVRQDGRLTAWCAQHDERTLEPAWARAYEPPSLSGHETVGLVRVLMKSGKRTPAVVAAIDGAVAWLEAVAIRGLRVEAVTGADGGRDRRAIRDRAAGPLWARFYELGSNRPMFIGRDSVIRYDYNEIERERRVGYAYLGTWPADLLTREYPRWRAGLGPED